MSGPKPRILVAIDWYLPAYKGGGPIRSIANMVASLSDTCEFLILTSDRDYGDKQAHPGIEKDVWTELPDGNKVRYCSPDQLSYRHVRKVIEETDFDVLYLNSMFSIKFTLFPLWNTRSCKPEKPVVLAPRGMLHAGALALKPTKKKLFLTLFKWVGMHKQISFHATDDQEVQDIQGVFGKSMRIHQAANLAAPPVSAPIPVQKQSGSLKLIYLSRISPKKGLDFLLNCLKDIKGAVSLSIYGPNEEPVYWQKCEALMAVLPPSVKVSVSGPVPPQEIPGILAENHVFVMPTHGENFGHAILESLSASRPVLISDQTPWHNLAAVQAGYDISMQDQAAWLKALQHFTDMDERGFAAWVQGAWHFAQKQFEQSSAPLDTRQMFLQAISEANAPK